MEGGHARDALVNMTGGVGEDISVADYTESEEKRKKLFQILNSAIEDRALISASISVKKKLSYCQIINTVFHLQVVIFEKFQFCFLLHVTKQKGTFWSKKKIKFYHPNVMIYYSKKPYHT